MPVKSEPAVKQLKDERRSVEPEKQPKKETPIKKEEQVKFESIMEFEMVVQQQFGELAPECKQAQNLPTGGTQYSSRFQQQLKQSELKAIKFTPTHGKASRLRSVDRPMKEDSGSRNLDAIS